jgi:hypothetical protein
MGHGLQKPGGPSEHLIVNWTVCRDQRARTVSKRLASLEWSPAAGETPRVVWLVKFAVPVCFRI